MKQYMVVQGDVWDYISWKLYQDEGLSHILLAANPTLRHVVIFDVPTMINVPDKPLSKARTQVNLPPWKQV